MRDGRNLAYLRLAVVYYVVGLVVNGRSYIAAGSFVVALYREPRDVGVGRILDEVCILPIKDTCEAEEAELQSDASGRHGESDVH